MTMMMMQVDDSAGFKTYPGNVHLFIWNSTFCLINANIKITNIDMYSNLNTNIDLNINIDININSIADINVIWS